MSWSVSGTGKAPALRAKLAQDFAGICLDYQESVVKDAAAALVDHVLAFPVGTAMRVEASGGGGAVSVTVEAVYGFVE